MASIQTNSPSTIHVMMFPFLAFGHISPHVQLARKLIHTSPSNIKITFLTANGSVPRVTALLPSSPSVSVVPIYLPPVSGLPSGSESTADLTPDGAEAIKISLDKCKPQVEEILRTVHPDIVIFDFSQPWLPSLAKALGIVN
ncbi:hypothetical protein LUZ60_007997 [Juncus effusus]|nr:hypothetical protein LUZ60_007997 [Juncus effusus]